MATAADHQSLPSGFYDRTIHGAFARRLADVAVDSQRVSEVSDSDELRERLLEVVRRELGEILDARQTDHISDDQCLELVSGILKHCRGTDPEVPGLSAPLRLLTGIQFATGVLPELPMAGLSRSWLFTAGKGDPALMAELRAELAAADQVDILVSFITWSGVRKVADVLESATVTGSDGLPRTRVRVLTTTYTGATERRALDWLARLPGVTLKVSLDGRRTRLHAKAWIMHRATGFGSAYVGSANLSGAALTGGLEWTVKFTQAGDPDLYVRAEAHFETLWNDAEFQAYDPASPEQVRALDQALRAERGPGTGPAGVITWLGIEAKAFQREILDRLAAERRHGRTRNLLVAATGTGKTVIAAFDYRRTCEAVGGRPRLLFVAHREEILHQAREVFAQVLREPGFGCVLAGGRDPEDDGHCFATIQSLNSRRLVEQRGADYWHTVILDECHHVAAASYEVLMQQVRPSVLLGLTATPERGDGRNILSLFDQRPEGGPAAELRLWQALDQQLLAPFEYYGCADETDLSGVPWDQAGERTALEGLLTGNHARARTAINAFGNRVADPRHARALAFCVSVGHAEFMAEEFRRAGIPAEAVTGQTPNERRRTAPSRLERREVNVLCTCDLYNEGIDLPSVDTLLFLRPTQSPVIFQQQLGRGLRLSDGKDCCVVVDLVGRHREDFRFDRLLAAMTGLPRSQLVEQVEHGFAGLPPGCHIQLDRISRDRVLAGLRNVARLRWSLLARELAAYAALPGRGAPTLTEFVVDQGLELNAVYPDRGRQPVGWTALRRAAGLLPGTPDGFDVEMGRRLPSLLHHDDPAYLTCSRRVAEGEIAWDTAAPADRRRLDMLAGQLFPNREDACTGRELESRLRFCPHMCDELRELATLLDETSDLVDTPLPGAPAEWPLRLHGSYSLREIVLACGWLRPEARHLPQGGVLALDAQRIELLFITLDKSAGFSARTSYHDYAISPELFHWQTQNSCGPGTRAGKRYLGQEPGWGFQLFVRPTKQDAYRALGAAALDQAEGERPMSIVWRLKVPMPAALFRSYSVLRTA